MGIPNNYFKTAFSKLNVNKTQGGVGITLDLSRFGKTIDIKQDALDAQVWNDMQKYMPQDTGNLIQQTNILNQSIRGEVCAYPPATDYGRYQYEGKLYVDPLYNIGAFHSPDFGFWSRKGVKKIESERELEYSNPIATPHWDETAYNNHKSQWVRVAKKA